MNSLSTGPNAPAEMRKVTDLPEELSWMGESLPPLPDTRFVDTTRTREPLQVIGSGAFGTVTLMSDNTVEKKSFIGNPERRNAFDAEVAALSSLNHQNIVTFIESYISIDEYGEEYGHLVIERALGKTVRNWLTDHKDDPVLYLRALWYPFVQTLILAIEYIHSQGVHHLDLHPSNVMVNITPAEKTLKVIDFGLSCNRMNSSTCGRPGHAVYYTAFVSDEKMSNYQLLEPEDMRMMDLYSVGALAYLWWFGSPPYAEIFKPASPEGAWLAWLIFSSQNRLRFPPTLEEEDPVHPRAIQAMRKLLCNPRAPNAGKYSLRGKSNNLPADLKTLALPETLWPPR